VGYHFNDPHVAWEALQMAGSGVFFSGGRKISDGNKRLAVLGDLALELILCKNWYEGGDQKGALCTCGSGIHQLTSTRRLERYPPAHNLEPLSRQARTRPRPRVMHSRQSAKPPAHLVEHDGRYRRSCHWSSVSGRRSAGCESGDGTPRSLGGE